MLSDSPMQVQPSRGSSPGSAASIALDRTLEGRFLTMDETSLRATPKGMRRLNAVLASLLA